MKEKLTEQEINLIKVLTREGHSLNKINSKLARSKTTVYYHFRKIRGQTVYPISVRSGNGELNGEFMGLFAGDGSSDKTSICQYRTRLFFNITEKLFVDNLIDNVLMALFAKRPMVFKEKSKYTLCYYSKNIHKFIDNYLTWNNEAPKTYSVHLQDRNYSKRFMVGFIRGSLDSDGYLSSNRISFATVSPRLKDNIVHFLTKLGFTHSAREYHEKRPNRVNIYQINVWKESFDDFLSTIKPRNIKNAPAGIRISERPVPISVSRIIGCLHASRDPVDL
jgi:hypothetical protein